MRKYKGRQIWCKLLLAGMVLALLTGDGRLAAEEMTQVAAQEDAQGTETQGTEAVTVSLADGMYLIDVQLSGGSGKASVSSPAEMMVQSGKAYAKIVFSSPNYDYMISNDVVFYADTKEGNSAFYIPILQFDAPMPIVADTTAMSTPHEIAYTLYFDSASIQSRDTAQKADTATDNMMRHAGYFAGACAGGSFLLIGGIALIVVLVRKKR